jgi:hypothetical protein
MDVALRLKRRRRHLIMAGAGGAYLTRGAAVPRHYRARAPRGVYGLTVCSIAKDYRLAIEAGGYGLIFANATVTIE